MISGIPWNSDFPFPNPEDKYLSGIWNLESKNVVIKSE
jgi:hypothetical protein